MIALLPARRRADAFADALDALLDDRPDPDARFDALLQVVADLVDTAAVAPVRPRDTFTADLRERLMLAADTELVATDQRLLLPTAGRGGNRRQTRTRAAVAALALVAGTAGVATASASSVPGDSLYPFKLGTEQVRSLLSFGDVAQGKDSLGQASDRLDEVTELLRGNGDRARLPATVGAFVDAAHRGSEQLFQADQGDPDNATMSTVREWAGTEMSQLERAFGSAPRSLRPALARAAVVVAGIDQEASLRCSSCGARAPLTTPSDLRLAAGSLDELLTKQPDVTTPGRGASAPGRQGRSGQGRAGNGSSSSPSAGPRLPDLSGPLTGGADGGSGAAGGTGTQPGMISGILGDVTGSGGTSSGGAAGTPKGTGGKVNHLPGNVTKKVGGTLKGTGQGVGDTLGDVLGGDLLGGGSGS